MISGKSFASGPGANFHWQQLFMVEFIFTFVLAFVVLSVATTQTPSKFIYGLAIGFCIVVGGYAAGPISGGHLNPAVSLGIDVAHRHIGWFVAYWVAQFLA